MDPVVCSNDSPVLPRGNVCGLGRLCRRHLVRRPRMRSAATLAPGCHAQPSHNLDIWGVEGLCLDLPAILTSRLTRNECYRSQEFLRREGHAEHLVEEVEDIDIDVEVWEQVAKNAANDQKPNNRTLFRFQPQ